MYSFFTAADRLFFEHTTNLCERILAERRTITRRNWNRRILRAAISVHCGREKKNGVRHRAERFIRNGYAMICEHNVAERDAHFGGWLPAVATMSKLWSLMLVVPE